MELAPRRCQNPQARTPALQKRRQSIIPLFNHAQSRALKILACASKEVAFNIVKIIHHDAQKISSATVFSCSDWNVIGSWHGLSGPAQRATEAAPFQQ